MRYECPSCKLQWKDGIVPLERLSHPTCIFCSGNHTQKELLNWQMNHLEDIDPKFFALILRHFYAYVNQILKTLEERVDEIE